MRQLDLPTAEYSIHSTMETAENFLRDNISNGYQVIKKDGLASGKGVCVLKDDRQNSLARGIICLDEIYEEDESAKVLIEKKSTAPNSAKVSMATKDNPATIAGLADGRIIE